MKQWKKDKSGQYVMWTDNEVKRFLKKPSKKEQHKKDLAYLIGPSTNG